MEVAGSMQNVQKIEVQYFVPVQYFEEIISKKQIDMSGPSVSNGHQVYFITIHVAELVFWAYSATFWPEYVYSFIFNIILSVLYMEKNMILNIFVMI